MRDSAGQAKFPTGNTVEPQIPAFASLLNVAYHGPAIWGNARAVSAFLLQRQLYRPGEPERVGWILFSAEALRHGERIQIDIDLGQGPHTLTFAAPGL